jgi:threonine dehydrogenase-like Zn-dependent dehydrogenase
MREPILLTGPSTATRKALRRAWQACLDPGHGVVLRKGVELAFRHRAGAVLRPHAIGICRSDAKEAAGMRPGPSQFGHELVADVVECWGSAALKSGDVVCLDPNVALERSSGFADLIALSAPPRTLESALFKVAGARAPLERYVLAEPVACAEHCARIALAGLERLPEHAIVVGAGTMGLFIAIGLQRRGVAVTLANRSASRLQFVERLGLPGIALKQLDADMMPAGLVVLATTFVSLPLLVDSIALVRHRGRITIFGGIEEQFDGFCGIDIRTLRQSEQRVLLHCSRDKAIELAGSYGLERCDFLYALELIGSGAIPASLLAGQITGRHALDELPAVLHAMNNGDDLGKRLVVPNLPSPKGKLP